MSLSEREKQISYINAYLWNLEKWYRSIYLQGRNRDTDVENRPMDTVGEGRVEQVERAAVTRIHYCVENRQLVGSCRITQPAELGAL